MIPNAKAKPQARRRRDCRLERLVGLMLLALNSSLQPLIHPVTTAPQVMTA